MRTELAIVFLSAVLVVSASARSPDDLASQYKDAHAGKDLTVLVALSFTNGALLRAIHNVQRAEAEHLHLRITKTEIQRLAGDAHVDPQMMQMHISFDLLSQTNGSPVIAQWSRTIQRFGTSWFFRIPETGSSITDEDWKSYRSRFSDRDIAHYRNRAIDVFNDPNEWNRLRTEFEGPFELASEHFQYECDPAGREAAKIVVIVPVRTKKPSPNATFVEITFERHMEAFPVDEIVKLHLMRAL